MLSRANGHALAIAVFVRPEGWSDEEVRGSLWSRVARMPGVTAWIDRDAREARLFGARTSGQILVFGADGKLGFSGGITPSRGHEGDSPGLDAAIRFASGQAAPDEPVARSPVFGCALFSTSEKIGSVARSHAKSSG